MPVSIPIGVLRNAYAEGYAAANLKFQSPLGFFEIEELRWVGVDKGRFNPHWGSSKSKRKRHQNPNKRVSIPIGVLRNSYRITYEDTTFCFNPHWGSSKSAILPVNKTKRQFQSPLGFFEIESLLSSDATKERVSIPIGVLRNLSGLSSPMLKCGVSIPIGVLRNSLKWSDEPVSIEGFNPHWGSSKYSKAHRVEFNAVFQSPLGFFEISCLRESFCRQLEVSIPIGVLRNLIGLCYPSGLTGVSIPIGVLRNFGRIDEA